jgi:hypothetical protein
VLLAFLVIDLGILHCFDLVQGRVQHCSDDMVLAFAAGGDQSLEPFMVPPGDDYDYPVKLFFGYFWHGTGGS